jgi:hypothetical protein
LHQQLPQTIGTIDALLAKNPSLDLMMTETNQASPSLGEVTIEYIEARPLLVIERTVKFF